MQYRNYIRKQFTPHFPFPAFLFSQYRSLTPDGGRWWFLPLANEGGERMGKKKWQAPYTLQLCFNRFSSFFYIMFCWCVLCVFIPQKKGKATKKKKRKKKNFFLQRIITVVPFIFNRYRNVTIQLVCT